MKPASAFFSFAITAPLRLVDVAEALIAKLRPEASGLIRGRAAEHMLSRSETVTARGLPLRVLTTNYVTAYRARSVETKEPETLDWIDHFDTPAVLWDIGANVGMYSIYAAKRHPSIKVYAFEPSVMNLELLARNLALNDLGERVCIVPIPIFEKCSEDQFRLQNLDRGGALSAFSVAYDHAHRPLKTILSYRTIGLSLDEMARTLKIPLPDHIKIDVDGIEHLILKGAAAVLASPQVKSVLVEINDQFDEQSLSSRESLTEHGFKLATRGEGNIANQIWRRG